jgi:hypothetical protein
MKSVQDIQITLPIWIKCGKKKRYLNLNQYRNWHYQVSNNIKKKFKEQVGGNLDFSILGQVEIDYVYYAPDKRKRDLMNVIAVADKFFQDALVETGCIETDDTDTVVKITSLFGGTDKEDARIVATIKQYKIT